MNRSREYLTEFEKKLVIKAKAAGLLKSYTAADWNGVTKNGGIAVLCSDGDIDAFEHHAQVISRRPHCIKLFGGPLLLARNFPDYQHLTADLLLNQIQLGMLLKRTGTVFLKFHHPCGLAIRYNLDLIQIIKLAQEVHRMVCQSGQFKPEKIYTLLHVKKPEKQATYLLNPDFVLKHQNQFK